MLKIRYALLSVSDKAGIIELARYLSTQQVTILSTSGTHKLLADSGIQVTEISDYTGSPEIMNGRVKTLHPRIHGGLLGRRDSDREVMAEHNIEPIDLLVVNLYPFEATVSRSECTLSEAIEKIDIGGPAMVRSAAKNYRDVAVITDINSYQSIIDELRHNNGALTDTTCFHLAQKAFAYTANYDANICNYLNTISVQGEHLDYPQTFTMQFNKRQDLRYGENPHQTAAFYTQADPPLGTLATARQRQGKALSYNNIVDADVALECVLSYQQPACVIVKHANPCGVAVAGNTLQAYQKAYQADPTSAFGGIIAFNMPLDAETAKVIIKQQFTEVIIAPSIEQDALESLSSKENIRVLETGCRTQAIQQLTMKRISAGLLIQDNDQGSVQKSKLQFVSKRQPSKQELDDLLFAWQVVKHVKSNAIVYARNKQTIGIGAGQMSRVYSTRIAALKAQDSGLEIKGSAMASDAFFPFRDSVDSAAQDGITAIIQPGGSVRDDEVITAANDADIAMVFTGMRHFLH